MSLFIGTIGDQHNSTNTLFDAELSALYDDVKHECAVYFRSLHLGRGTVCPSVAYPEEGKEGRVPTDFGQGRQANVPSRFGLKSQGPICLNVRLAVILYHNKILKNMHTRHKIST